MFFAFVQSNAITFEFSKLTPTNFELKGFIALKEQSLKMQSVNRQSVISHSMTVNFSNRQSSNSTFLILPPLYTSLLNLFLKYTAPFFIEDFINKVYSSLYGKFSTLVIDSDTVFDTLNTSSQSHSGLSH